MASLGQLVVWVEANTVKFTEGLDKADYAAQQRARSIQKHIDGVHSTIKSLAATAGLGLGLNKLWGDFKEITAAESGLVKIASRLNTTASILSSFGGIARAAGMDSDAFNSALTQMDRRLSMASQGIEQSAGKLDENGEEIIKASRAYDQLGIRVQEFIKLPLDQKLMVMSEQMQKNIDPADRINIAMQLFGKNGAGMVQPLSQGGEALQKLIDRERELNPLTDKMASTGARAAKAASELSIAWHGFGQELNDYVAPAITHVMNELTKGLAAANRFEANAQKAGELFGAAAEKRFRALQPRAAGGVGPFGETVEPDNSVVIPPEVIKPPQKPAPPAPGGGGKAGGGGGSGGGLEAAGRQLENFLESMRSETAQAYGETFSVIDSWYNKQARALKDLEAKAGESFEARGVLDAAYYAKRDKLISDFAAKEQQTFLDNAQKMEQNWLASLDLTKGVFDSLAQTAPLLSQQLVFKERGLELEIQINQATFEGKLLELEKAHIIEKAQADELRGLQALMNQQKRANFGMENDRGLAGWAFGRQKEIDQRNPVKDMMGGAENWLGATFGNAMVDAMQGKKMDLKNIWQNIMSDAMRWSMQRSVRNIADWAAGAKGHADKGLSGISGFSRRGGVGEGETPVGSAGASLANQWSEIGERFDAGIGQFSESTGNYDVAAQTQTESSGVLASSGVQAGISAASMGLSAIGLLTGSEFMMKAALVLQVAALALEIAASIDAIPFLHGGGQIAHSGLLVAHNGLAGDERLIIAQTGEGILQRSAMRAYANMGIGFNDLNHGRLPAVPLAAGRGGGGGGGHYYDNRTYGDIILAPVINHKMTQRDWDEQAGLAIKAVDKKTGRKGTPAMGIRR